jgi:hypothetical protein
MHQSMRLGGPIAIRRSFYADRFSHERAASKAHVDSTYRMCRFYRNLDTRSIVHEPEARIAILDI